VRAAWGVALLFVLPSLAFSLLLQQALSLSTVGGPFFVLGFVVVPWIGGAPSARAAFGRGLLALALLLVLFSLVVHLRLWTNAGGPVLAREGLVRSARFALLFVAVASLFGAWLVRPRKRRSLEDPEPIR
jgi:hypothetical protein